MKVRESLANWAARNLICGWKKSWKFLSMQGMLLALTTQGVWASLPDDWRASVPTSIVTVLTMACLALGVAGRLVKQPGLPDENQSQ